MERLGRILGWLAVPAVLGAWTPDHWFDSPKSPRIANYRIEATLDWKAKVLDGEEALTWRNTGTAPAAELPLHLYLNAFKGPQSLYYKEKTGSWGGRTRPWGVADERRWGYCRLVSVHLGNLLLDGHYGEDESVYWVRLPRPVPPGGTVRLDIAWESRFPLLHTRNGWNRDFLLGSQWFPSAGVYDGATWNCRAYYPAGGPYADFGTYDVRLSLPADLLLAHTGTPLAAQPAPDPRHPANRIWSLHAEDVHDFAWVAMPSRTWGVRSFEYRGVKILCFSQPDRLRVLDQERQAVQRALKHASEWLFPYPYPVLTLVDVPDGAEGMDRSGFPTLVTVAPLRLGPLGQRFLTERTTLRQVGGQWFHGLLAADGTAEPWLDDGLASWFAQKTMDRSYQAVVSTRRFEVGTDTEAATGYWRDPSVDPVTAAGNGTRDAASGTRAVRYKTPMVLNQLETLIGRPRMEQILQEYAREMAFRHPSGRDFQRVAERVSGRGLAGFWRDFMDGTDVLDMVIGQVGVREVLEGGWMESGRGPTFVPPQPAAPGRRGFVTLYRRGGLRLPVTLWARLENRTEQRVSWDGQDRWVTFEFDSPVTQALLDPDGNYPMLKDRLHAGYSAQPVRRGLHYWSQMLWGMATALLQGAGLG